MPTRAETTTALEPTVRRWTGVSQEDRRAERRALLLDAAFDLLGTEGFAGTTVRAVCSRARLNARYFYESFTDLDELLIAVYDRVVEELGAEVRAAVASAAPKDQTRAAIDCTVRYVDEDRRRGRVMYVEALGNEALNRRRMEAGHSLVGVIGGEAARRHGALPAGEQIGLIGAAILVGGFSELLAAWLDGRIEVSRDQLTDDATALFGALAESAAKIAARRVG